MQRIFASAASAACLLASLGNDAIAQSTTIASHLPGKVHLLPATLETTQWGWFVNAQPPVLTIDSGDTVIIETMMHSHNQVVPGRTIEEINRRGVTVLLVEQNAHMALSIARRGYVLETGTVRLEDEAKNLLRNDEVRKAYLGG